MERECALPNDPTLDTFEVKKIDEAIANMSPTSGKSGEKKLPHKRTIKMKKKQVDCIIVRGKKYRIFNDNYLIENEAFMANNKKNQNVFMGSGTGINALKNIENRRTFVLKNPKIG